MEEPESPWLDPKSEAAQKGGPPTPKPETPKPESPIVEGWERKGNESPKVQTIRKKKGGRTRRVDKFCRCVKKVAKTVKARRGSTRDQAGIAICTKSMLWPRGRTLKRVQCRGVRQLETQKR